MSPVAAFILYGMRNVIHKTTKKARVSCIGHHSVLRWLGAEDLVLIQPFHDPGEAREWNCLARYEEESGDGHRHHHAALSARPGVILGGRAVKFEHGLDEDARQGSRRQCHEQLRLAGEVVLEAAVRIEVIVREVGEHADRVRLGQGRG